MLYLVRRLTGPNVLSNASTRPALFSGKWQADSERSLKPHNYRSISPSLSLTRSKKKSMIESFVIMLLLAVKGLIMTFQLSVFVHSAQPVQ